MSNTLFKLPSDLYLELGSFLDFEDSCNLVRSHKTLEPRKIYQSKKQIIINIDIGIKLQDYDLMINNIHKYIPGLKSIIFSLSEFNDFYFDDFTIKAIYFAYIQHKITKFSALENLWYSINYKLIKGVTEQILAYPTLRFLGLRF